MVVSQLVILGLVHSGLHSGLLHSRLQVHATRLTSLMASSSAVVSFALFFLRAVFCARCRPARSRSSSSQFRMVERSPSISKRLLSAREVVRNDRRTLVTSRRSTLLSLWFLRRRRSASVRCSFVTTAGVSVSNPSQPSLAQLNPARPPLGARRKRLPASLALTIMPQLCNYGVLLPRLLLQLRYPPSVVGQRADRALGVGAPELELAQLDRRALELRLKLGRRLS